MVDSGTRNAFAIWSVVSPPTARRVRAIADAGVSDGWQHRYSRTSESSASGTFGSSAVVDDDASAVASSRSARAASLRCWSMSRRSAVLTSHAAGRSGMPSRGQ